MKVFVILAALCGTLLGSPQSTSSNIGSNSDSSSSSISNVIAGKIAGLLSNIYDLLGERAKDLPSCSFPFTYKNVTYDNCTTDHDYYGMYWCSTKTDDQDNHAYNEWRHCQESDGLLMDDASVAANQTLASVLSLTGAGGTNGNNERYNRPVSENPSLSSVLSLTGAGGTIGCPDNSYEYNSKCYRFVKIEKTEAEAKDYCERKFGKLARINNAVDFYNAMKPKVGVPHKGGNGLYLYQISPNDNQCIDFTFYDDGNPSFGTVPCEDKIFFICERNKEVMSAKCFNCVSDSDCTKSTNNCGNSCCPNPIRRRLAVYRCSDDISMSCELQKQMNLHRKK